MDQGCTFVYEHHDPRTGKVMFVGRAKGLDAWNAAEAALLGQTPTRNDRRGLYWFLRDLIQAGYGEDALAPTIVHCGRDAQRELDDRIALYGRENLLNGRSDTLVSGADPKPNTGVCQPGFPCQHQFQRVRHLERVARQTGVYGLYVSNRYSGKALSGFWRSGPIIRDTAILNEIRREAAQEEPEAEKVDGDAFLLKYAIRKILTCLREESYDRAHRLAAVIQDSLKRDFFILEVDPDGDLVAFHEQSIQPAQYAAAKDVLDAIGRDLKQARVAVQQAIWDRVDDGSYLRERGALTVERDPNAPAVPPPNHKPFKPVRVALRMPPPSKVAVKPSEPNPTLEAAFARFSSILAGDVPPPVIPAAEPRKHDDPFLIAALAQMETGMGLAPKVAAEALDPVSPEDWQRLARAEPPKID